MRTTSKLLILLVAISILILTAVSCRLIPDNKGPASEGSNNIKAVIEKLEGLGYYRYITADKVEKVKQESIAAGYIFRWEESGRDFTCDAEDLAEDGVLNFFKEIEPFLKKQGVKIKEAKDIRFGNDYVIKLNGRNYTIYSKQELDSGDIWELSTIRAFRIINELLEKAESSERIYSLYEGNGLRGVFLTKEMYEVIKDFKSYPENEMPTTIPDRIYLQLDSFKLDKSSSDMDISLYGSTINFLNNEIALDIWLNNRKTDKLKLNIKKCEEYVNWLQDNIGYINNEIRNSDLVDLKNKGWLLDGESKVSPDQLIERISLLAVSIDIVDNKIDLVNLEYDDDNIFYGHRIHVDFNKNKKVKKIDF